MNRQPGQQFDPAAAEFAALIAACDQAQAQRSAALLWGCLLALKPTSVAAAEILAWLRASLARPTRPEQQP